MVNSIQTIAYKVKRSWSVEVASSLYPSSNIFD
jgi:hypothetical protein